MTISLCRTCLVIHDTKNTIFLFWNNQINLLTNANILMEITSFKIKHNDGLPQTICKVCFEKLLNAYEFKKLCEKSEKILRSEDGKKKLEYFIENSNSLLISEKNQNLLDLSINLDFDANEDKSKIALFETENDLEQDTKFSNNIRKDFFENNNESFCYVSSQMKNFRETNSNSFQILTDCIENERVENTKMLSFRNNLNDELDLKFKILIKSEQEDSYNSNNDSISNEVQPNKIIKSLEPLKNSNLNKKNQFIDNMNNALSKNNKKKKNRILIRKKINDKKIHKCSTCDKIFLKLCLLNVHEMTHSKNEKSYECEQCHKKFNFSYDLKLHVRRHTNERPYACKNCDKKFFRPYELKVHLNQNHIELNGDIKLYKCEQCGALFKHNSSLNAHILNHLGVKPYVCETCGKKFSKSSHLNDHIKTHTGEKPFKCDLCGKKFTQPSQLKAHSLRIHDGDRPYVCETCGKKFKSAPELKKHFVVHTGERLYSCEHCDSKFSNSSNLITHTKRHIGEKQYECELCGKKYFDSYQLKIHKRTHTGEKPYECKTCGKTFINWSGWSNHQKTHNDEMPFKCLNCKKKFKYKHSLERHLKRKSH